MVFSNSLWHMATIAMDFSASAFLCLFLSFLCGQLRCLIFRRLFGLFNAGGFPRDTPSFAGWFTEKKWKQCLVNGMIYSGNPTLGNLQIGDKGVFYLSWGCYKCRANRWDGGGWMDPMTRSCPKLWENHPLPILEIARNLPQRQSAWREDTD